MTETNENEILYHEEIVETCEIKPNPRVLMIVTNSDHFDEHHKTGVWFEEFAIPYLKFKEEGFFVTTSSLNGGPAPIDPASENIIDDIKWHEAKKALEDTTPLESIDYNFYDAVVFPGGHGPMFDIAESELIGEIVSSFDKKKKLIAAICHGPAGLLKAMSDGKAFVNEKKKEKSLANGSANPFGVSSFGSSPFGGNPFASNPFGSSPFGGNPFENLGSPNSSLNPFSNPSNASTSSGISSPQNFDLDAMMRDIDKKIAELDAEEAKQKALIEEKKQAKESAVNNTNSNITAVNVASEISEKPKEKVNAFNIYDDYENNVKPNIDLESKKISENTKPKIVIPKQVDLFDTLNNSISKPTEQEKEIPNVKTIVDDVPRPEIKVMPIQKNNEIGNIKKEDVVNKEENKPKINVDVDSVIVNDNVISDDEFFDDFFGDDY